jgi:uncharacterized membrane protein
MRNCTRHLEKPDRPAGNKRLFRMNEVAIARALHVTAIVFWIGGVAMVTTILLPAVRRLKSPPDRIAFFTVLEKKFAWQSRGSTLIAGLSGFYMIDRLELWYRFASPAFWWMHAMVGIWLVFTLMLFVLEPLFLHRWFLIRAEAAPESTFTLIQRLHWVLLALGLITILGATAGSHGFFLS